MANVFDVAKYIIEHAGKGGKMSTMKLQKLCYYSQAWSLVWDEAPLFDEEFEAWVNGPVCRPLFEKTRGQYYATVDDMTGGEDNLTDTQKATIDAVLNYYGKHDAQWLSQLTHMEDPWKLARADILADQNSDCIITKESMAIYYGGL